jgi:deoxyribodipyrimidine photo-lyase
MAENVTRFEEAALVDAATRVGISPTHLRADNPYVLAKWAATAGATQIATAYVTQGPLRDWLDQATPALAVRGISLCEWRRDWDSAIWPHSTAGFFKVKKQIPRILEKMVLT